MRLDHLLYDKSWLGELLVKIPASWDWPANFWSLLRFVGIFVVILLYRQDRWLGILAFGFFLYTDALDGVMARHQHRRVYLWLDIFFWLYVIGWIKREIWQKAGQWFDPLADKVFIISSLYYFGLVAKPILWPALFYLAAIVEIVSRLVIIPLIRGVIMKKSLVIKANKLGKAKFINEAIVGGLIMLAQVAPIDSALINGWLVVVIALSLGSMLGHIMPEKFQQWHLFND